MCLLLLGSWSFGHFSKNSALSSIFSDDCLRRGVVDA